jgi:type II secretion system protein G
MTALGSYKLDTGTFPTTEQGLQALRVKPGTRTSGRALHAQDIPKDPWGHDYVYKFPGDHGDEPDIISLGPTASPAAKGSMPTSSVGKPTDRFCSSPAASRRPSASNTSTATAHGAGCNWTP